MMLLLLLLFLLMSLAQRTLCQHDDLPRYCSFRQMAPRIQSSRYYSTCLYRYLNKFSPPPGRTCSSSVVTITRPLPRSSSKNHRLNRSFRYTTSPWNQLPASFRVSIFLIILLHTPLIPIIITTDTSDIHSKLKAHLFHCSSSTCLHGLWAAQRLFLF